MFFLVAARRASRLGGSAHAAAKRECRHPGCCRSKTESANACQISSGFADRMRHRIQLTLAVRGRRGAWPEKKSDIACLCNTMSPEGKGKMLIRIVEKNGRTTAG